MKTENIAYGFNDFNGNLWCNAWIDSYNAFNEILKNIHSSNKSKIEFYLDQRHKLFCLYLALSKKAKR